MCNAEEGNYCFHEQLGSHDVHHYGSQQSEFTHNDFKNIRLMSEYFPARIYAFISILMLSWIWKNFGDSILFKVKYKNSNRKCKKEDQTNEKNLRHPNMNSNVNSETLKRKMIFLKSHEGVYGYKSSIGGHIDKWRTKEFPNLIPPMAIESHNHHKLFKRQSVPGNIQITQENVESEVYLDYAGAALPSKSQLQKCTSILTTSILANPHSSGPAANRTSLHIQKTRKLIMDHFGCESNNDNHPGYEILFTSGTTQSLQIVASCFPWNSHHNHKEYDSATTNSVLLYSHNVHTSVIGMRGPAIDKGAHFRCEHLSKICAANEETFLKWQISDATDKDKQLENPSCESSSFTDINHLLVIPAECNFGGFRPNLESII